LGRRSAEETAWVGSAFFPPLSQLLQVTLGFRWRLPGHQLDEIDKSPQSPPEKTLTIDDTDEE
jgi:hypothetical protein